MGLSWLLPQTLGSETGMREITPGPDAHPSTRIDGGTRVGVENPDAAGVALLLQQNRGVAQPPQDPRSTRLRTRTPSSPTSSAPGWACGAFTLHQLAFTPDRFADDTVAFAARIARLPTMTSLLIKESDLGVEGHLLAPVLLEPARLCLGLRGRVVALARAPSSWKY
jgi:hypothetical protein